MPDNEFTLVEHLDELRKRIIYCLVPFVICAVASLPFARSILDFLRFPASGLIEKLAFFSPQEVALVYGKISLVTALILSLPIIFYHLWKFISPALEEKQKLYISSFIFWASLAFLCGAVFGYLLLVPFSLKFLLALAGADLQPVISLSKYISFILALTIGSAIAFEMPVLVWLLNRMGIVNHRFLREKRRYVIIGIFVFSAIITPTTDPLNMTLLALPMIVLYEISIWIARWNERQKPEAHGENP